MAKILYGFGNKWELNRNKQHVLFMYRFAVTEYKNIKGWKTKCIFDRFLVTAATYNGIARMAFVNKCIA